MTKFLLLFLPFGWAALASAQQPFPPTSIPLEETRISLLENGSSIPSLGAIEKVSNFRLFLKYDADESIQVNLGSHGIELPAGEGAIADATYEHVPGKPATIHIQRQGDLKPLRIEVPDSTVGQNDGAGSFAPLPGKDFPMDGPHTLMVRFQTTEENGTLVARAPEQGKWKPKGKTLFLRNGRLTYDIGWEGAVKGGPNLADGKEHIAVMTVDEDGKVELFVDGKSVAKRELASDDDPKHVFKIGSTATDFAGDFGGGEINQVLFWERNLNPEEVKSLGNGNALEVNTPDFHWNPAASPTNKKPAPELVSYGAEPGYPAEITFHRIEGVTFHEAWIQPLQKSDHAEILAQWDDNAFERGKSIYAQLCVTCHGTATQEGSIPLSLKFHDPNAKFKNGSDPFRMWQTLVKGYGLMTPMPQYSTRQKYDVIHYIREEFLAESNPDQHTKVDNSYLALLPRGMSLIEEKEATKRPPQYELMDFSNVLFGTYQIEPGPIDTDVNIAQKGIAIRIDPGPGGVSKGKAWAVYDHDTMRLAAVYTGDQFVDWKGIDFDGSHGTHTSIVGDRILVTPDQPGWAHPETGEWEAPRVIGKDGRKFGPIPREWARYRGMHLGGPQPILEYTVGDTSIYESILTLPEAGLKYVRALRIGESKQDLLLRTSGSESTIRIPAEETPTLRFIALSKEGEITVDISNALTPGPDMLNADAELASNPPIPVTTRIEPGTENGPFAVDVLTVPDADLNPHQSWMRTSGFDFYPDGKRAAVCTWMGDVWIVEGIDQLEGKLTWKRICSGLFQPLGLKIVDGSIYVTCRDQLAKLHDKNGDETIDFIECINNDHQVTEHFHEFAMGLQTDADGNFYYAKSARHAKDSLVPHHGTLLRVSRDGEKTDILATGFRAANGVCLNPDGTFIVTDQEGHWNPKNRINWVNGDGPNEFFGNIYGYSPVTDTADSAMKNPLCWITNGFDRSPSELLWVPEDAAWGPLNGQLLNLSYGYGKVYVVPHEEVNGQKQGGMCELPFEQFPTGVMRGRFHPDDGQLYACGMFAWAGTQQQAGGFYRIRKTENPAFLPTKLTATRDGISFEMSDAIDISSALPSHFTVKTWDLKRTKSYGSKHFNEKEIAVTRSTVSEDGKTLTLTLPELKPTWGMSIEMKLTAPNGEPVERLIHNSIFELPE